VLLNLPKNYIATAASTKRKASPSFIIIITTKLTHQDQCVSQILSKQIIRCEDVVEIGMAVYAFAAGFYRESILFQLEKHASGKGAQTVEAKLLW